LNREHESSLTTSQCMVLNLPLLEGIPPLSDSYKLLEIMNLMM
jgi:hypothetical protein